MKKMFAVALVLAFTGAQAQAQATPTPTPTPTPKELYDRGMAAWTGKGAAKDLDQARSLLQQAAQQRYLEAFSILGLLEQSEGKDAASKRLAMAWFGRGAFSGDPRSQGVLATVMGARGQASPFSAALYSLAAEGNPKIIPIRDEEVSKLGGLGKLLMEAYVDEIRAQVALNRAEPLPLQFPADGVVSRGIDGLPRVVEGYGTHATFSGGRGESCDQPATLETPITSSMVRAGVEQNWLAAVYPEWKEVKHSSKPSPSTHGLLSMYDLTNARGESGHACVDITRSVMRRRPSVLGEYASLHALLRCGSLAAASQQPCSEAVVAATRKCGESVAIPDSAGVSDPAMDPAVKKLAACIEASDALKAYPSNKK